MCIKTILGKLDCEIAYVIIVLGVNDKLYFSKCLPHPQFLHAFLSLILVGGKETFEKLTFEYH